MVMDLFDRWRRTLDELRRLGRYRALSAAHGIDFSSNDYLGYAAVPDAPQRAHLSRSGAASRLLRGQHPIWDEVENALAAWHDAEATLMFSSGYCANEGLLSTLVETGDFLASDQFNHASLIDGARLARGERFIYGHGDLDHLESGLRQASAKRRPEQQLFIVSEALFGMDGDRAPLAELAELSARYHAHLIIDEAHSTGCFGASGSGLVDELGLRPGVLATVHTGGKALGVTGAYVCGSRLLKELLVNRCRHLIFTTALPPAIGAWWLDALKRVRSDDAGRHALHANAELFRRELRRHGCDALGRDYIVPVLLGDDGRAVAAANDLQERGYDVRAIRPPTVPPGSARLRISIHADHDARLLTQVAAAVADTARL
jgi:8-amino-7-oxononanoate synthase